MLNRLISNTLAYMPKKLVWQISKQYIAGETIDDAINAAKKLKSEGIMTTIDLLGEFITTLDEARANKNEYLDIIEAVKKQEINGYYSLKPTFFGLLIDKEIAYRHIREVVAKAALYHHFVRIDMEDSSCTDMEIELFRRLKTEFPENVGLVLQAYLKRTHQDIKNLKDLNSEDLPLNIRLCKGIYVEPSAIAFQNHDQINQHFLEDIELMLQEKMIPAIATHDKPIIEGAYKLIEKYKIPTDKYEFQMLYGVTPSLRRSIRKKGHHMRVYIPFGKQWFGYCTRRIKENPNIGSVILKAVFLKG
ncbi:MAG: proline dehydrogenase family protein [Pseudomonadota bacterium]